MMSRCCWSLPCYYTNALCLSLSQKANHRAKYACHQLCFAFLYLNWACNATNLLVSFVFLAYLASRCACYVLLYVPLLLCWSLECSVRVQTDTPIRPAEQTTTACRSMDLSEWGWIGSEQLLSDVDQLSYVYICMYLLPLPSSHLSPSTHRIPRVLCFSLHLLYIIIIMLIIRERKTFSAPLFVLSFKSSSSTSVFSSSLLKLIIS